MSSQLTSNPESAPSGAARPDFDVLIVGSGFGGSVSALRLTEKGYRVAVVESGRRFADEEFAETSWDLKRFLWAPQLGCFGVQRIHMLRNVMILAGAGVGGGSLVYANTLYRPPKSFFDDGTWAEITDWGRELEPYFDQAERMLGVVTYHRETNSDRVVKDVAADMGASESFHATPVGVYFGQDNPGPEQGPPSDPYFGGAGPARTPCTECGACMTGCRVGAKNTLVKNYLYLAEQAGAQVFPLTTVTDMSTRADSTWSVQTRRTGSLGRADRTVTAGQVILAAGAWGTQNLLHRLRADGRLAHLPDRVGEYTRTNSEALVGAKAPEVTPEHDFTEGVAITSSFHPDERTHIEPVRYGKGSNAMGLLQTLATDGDRATPRILQFLLESLRRPWKLGQLGTRNWSEKTLILLVMQNLDNSLTTFLKRGVFGRRLSSRQGHGVPNPSFIRAGHDAAARAAEKMGGMAGGVWSELFDIPLTAHFIGGCAVSSDAAGGVVDPYHRAWGYPTLSVIDGSTISANLGVNPSLTIAAQAERACAMWPNRGEADPRPSQQQPYRPVPAVPPNAPAVPTEAPAALRLPLQPVSRPAAGPDDPTPDNPAREASAG